jgi:hypothetical protein
MNLEMQRILDLGNAVGLPHLIWMLVDGLKQPYDVVAHRMTLGEIAQGLIFLEFREAANAFAAQQGQV